MNKLVVMETNDRCLQSALGDLTKKKIKKKDIKILWEYFTTGMYRGVIICMISGFNQTGGKHNYEMSC